MSKLATKKEQKYSSQHFKVFYNSKHAKCHPFTDSKILK